MFPYIPTTKPMKGEEQEALVAIFEDSHWYTPTHRLRLANDIIAAGFSRRLPQKVSKGQIWSYFFETIALAYCAVVVFDTGRMFVYGLLCALALGSLLTFIGALVINAGIDKESKP